MKILQRDFFILALVLGLVPAPVLASLSTLLEVEGRVGWSLDAASAGSVLVVDVPPDSTVEKAFLYAGEALHVEQPPEVTPTVNLDGVVYDSAEFIPLRFVQFPAPFSTGMQAFRADATDQIADLLSAGGPGLHQLPVLSHEFSPSRRHRPGVLLAVIYRSAQEDFKRIVISDGGADPAGDSAAFDLGTLRPGGPILLSLGIDFSTGADDQKTLVDVDGRRLTSVAGGWDGPQDRLLTVGGYLDSPVNPPDPFASPLIADSLDDELYDLSQGNNVDPSPFVSGLKATIVINTSNPSLDDNLFFAAVSVAQPLSVLEIPALSRQGSILLASMLLLCGYLILRR